MKELFHCRIGSNLSTRATFNVAALEDLIHLSSKGPSVADFEPAAAVDHWFEWDKSKGGKVLTFNLKIIILLNSKHFLSD